MRHSATLRVYLSNRTFKDKLLFATHVAKRSALPRTLHSIPTKRSDIIIFNPHPCPATSCSTSRRASISKMWFRATSSSSVPVAVSRRVVRFMRKKRPVLWLARSASSRIVSGVTREGMCLRSFRKSKAWTSKARSIF